jgi:hypothetical protein
MGYVAAGATQVVSLDFRVLSGTQAPPKGSLITLVVTDRDNGALVSRTVAVNFTIAMLERLVWPDGRLVLANPLPEGAALIFAPSSGNTVMLYSSLAAFNNPCPALSREAIFVACVG